MINFKWFPPFTLQVNESSTTSRTVYEVTISNSANSEVLLIDMAMEPEYTHHRLDYTHCGKVIFQVASINEVAKGTKSEGIEAGFFGCEHFFCISCFRNTRWICLLFSTSVWLYSISVSQVPSFSQKQIMIASTRRCHENCLIMTWQFL